MINHTPLLNAPLNPGQDHDLEAGLDRHGHSGSEGSVTSPLSDAPSLASTMSVLVDRGQSSREQISRAIGGSVSPRANPRNLSMPSTPTSVARPGRVSFRPESPSHGRGVARARRGTTLREQNPRHMPSRPEVVRYALRSSVGALAWIAPSVGLAVGLIVGLMRWSVGFAIANGVPCGLVALIVSLSAIRGWLRGIGNFASGQVSQVVAIDLDRLSLGKEIKFWLVQMGRPEQIVRWQCERTTETKQMAAFLGKLEQSRDFQNARTRPVVVERVEHLLDAMTQSRTVRQRVFEIAAEHCETCVDRVALGLNHMEMVIQNRRAEKGHLSERELLALGRGMFRMGMLETFAREKKMIGRPRPVDGDEPDDVEVLVNLQAHLRVALDLPLRSFTPDADSPEVGVVRVWQARNFVQSREGVDLTPATQQYQQAKEILRGRGAMPLPRPNWPALPMFLAEGYRPWAAHVARKYPSVVAAHQQRVRDYQSRLDQHFAKPRRSRSAYGGLSHDELARRAMFYYLYGAAFEMALVKLGTPAQPQQAAAAAGTLEMV